MSDYVAFKFKAVNAQLLKSLGNGEIFFAHPDRLNGPFDCSVNIPQALQNAIERSTGSARTRLEKMRAMSEFFEKVQLDLKGMGVFSMSLELENSLMWSHYGDNHRGICLTYSLPESFFYEHSKQILGIDRVKYGVNPLSDWFAVEAPGLDSFEQFGIALIVRALTVKAKPWEYEKEVRIIRRSEGAHVLDKGYLKQVCFGLATSKADMSVVREALNRWDYKGPFCRMVRTTVSDFAVKAIDLQS